MPSRMSSAVSVTPLGVRLVRLDEVAHRLDDARLEAGLVRAAGAGGDAVDVGADVLVGGLGPLQRDLDARTRPCARARRRCGWIGALAALGDDLRQVVGDAAVVRELELLAGGLVLEDDVQPAVQVGLGLEPLAHHLPRRSCSLAPKISGSGRK